MDTKQTVQATELRSKLGTNRERFENKRTFAAGIALGLSLSATGGLGYVLGLHSTNQSSANRMADSPSSLGESQLAAMMPELLQASATDGGENMAIATGPVGDDSEGFFALDFISGTIQGMVLNPRRPTSSAQYLFSVQDILGGPGKNPHYLMATASARISQTTPSSILYVVNTNTGMYAALGVPWDKTMEASGSPQGGTLTLLKSGQLREPIGLGRKTMNPPGGDKKPAAPARGAAANAAAKPPAGAKPADKPVDDAADDLFGAPDANPNAPGNPRKQR